MAPARSKALLAGGAGLVVVAAAAISALMPPCIQLPIRRASAESVSELLVPVRTEQRPHAALLLSEILRDRGEYCGYTAVAWS
jgi:hypothetical protein